MSNPAPPILPLYKVNHSRKLKKDSVLWFNLGIAFVGIILLFLFFMSIFIGSSYLQNHVDTETYMSALNKELPNTRNVVKKWSLSHLNGFDLTSLGPPVIFTNPNATLSHHRNHFHIPSTIKEINSLMHNVSTSTYYLRSSLHMPNSLKKLSFYSHNLTAHHIPS